MQRREFVAGTAALAALSALSPTAFATAQNRPRRVGLIGTGWYGKCDLLQLMNVEPVEVVSLCDVDTQALNTAAELMQARQASGKRPQTYHDYREMLAKKDLDIVLVDTPDHWHALPMIAAVESGADVYCQKPTAVDVLESKAMLDAARRTKRVVQIGTQRRSTPHLIEAKQRVIDAGLLGNVAYAEVCCYYHMRNRKTLQEAPDKPAPAHLDWEMWTGPAPLRPYNEIVHPRGWRAFMEYGNGIVGDMCVHMLDMVRWALGLGWPKSIVSAGGVLVDKAARANITDTQTATFAFDNLDVVWTHRSWGAAPDPDYPWAAIIYGDKGTLKLSVNRYEFIPQGRGEKLKGEAVIELDKFKFDAEDQKKWALELHVASAIRGHMQDFLKAVDQRSRPVADIEQGHISSASCILANLSQKLGRSLAWDPASHTVAGDAEATALLKRTYRQPWKHPADAV